MAVEGDHPRHSGGPQGHRGLDGSLIQIPWWVREDLLHFRGIRRGCRSPQAHSSVQGGDGREQSCLLGPDTSVTVMSCQTRSLSLNLARQF